tara:strand:- start:126332 stop:126577 length:246 start_codon:yes stop_codon:yes gene_type:complete
LSKKEAEIDFEDKKQEMSHWLDEVGDDILDWQKERKKERKPRRLEQVKNESRRLASAIGIKKSGQLRSTERQPKKVKQQLS